MMPMMASTAIHGAQARAAPGNSGRQKCRIPNVPIFSMTEASITEPAMGASTCASGSQVCSGKSGTLMANATKNARKSSICSPGAKISRPLDELVQNFRVAEGLRPVIEVNDGGQHQHRPGHSVEEEFHGGVDAPLVSPDADQEVHGHQGDFPENVEQEQVLRDEDAGQAEFQQQQEGVKFLGRWRMEFQEISTQMGVRNVVSSSSQRLMPSAPIWK